MGAPKKPEPTRCSEKTTVSLTPGVDDRYEKIATEKRLKKAMLLRRVLEKLTPAQIRKLAA